VTDFKKRLFNLSYSNPTFNLDLTSYRRKASGVRIPPHIIDMCIQVVKG